MRNPRSILITGASSGIGRALALAYAAPERRISLIGRNPSRLSEVAATVARKGADAQPVALDVRDREAMARWIEAADRNRPFDLVIANAGITTGLSPEALTEDPEAVRAIIATNLLGVLNTVEPLIAPMCSRKAGQIALVGSIAGLRGLPYSPAYCMTKAAVHAYAEALRGRLERNGVCVSLVVAGFVKTPLNDSISAIKPLEVSDSRAASIIRNGLARRRATIVFPWPLYLAARFGRLLPARIYDRLMAHIEANVPETKERV